jgi:nucleotide-binding universal stress UspA family protein
MIKDLVVNLAVKGKRDVAADYALSVATTLEAHATGIAFAYEPTPPPTVLGSMPLDFLAAQREESEKIAKAATARFDEAVRRAGVSGESHALSATLIGAADTFSRLARRFDLSVVAQNEPEDSGVTDPLIEGALFETGRPVIVVPYIQKAGLTLDRVMVCWDGSKTAARAIGDAMPFLERAGSVDVVIVASERSKSDEIPGADMGQHLARHVKKVDVKRIVATETDVPNTILSYAADNSADFLVMGAYGHSRLREFILGGATRGILSAMTVPTLMSH